MIDLHTHTHISDGTLSPKELIKLAKATGLKAVAITDHDAIEGLDEAQEAADELGIQLVKGIEFDVRFKGLRLHILGLNIDHRNEGFLNIYNEYRKGKDESVEYNLAELRKDGIELQREGLRPYTVGPYMDRMAIAKYLFQENLVSTMTEAWVKHIDKIPMSAQDLIGAEKAIKAIHLAGGKAFLAHFHLPIGLGTLSESDAVASLKELQQLGLDGLEYYYPSFTEEDQKTCGTYIERFGFKPCGGTDFHGANREHIKLGIGEGDFQVPDSILDGLDSI